MSLQIRRGTNAERLVLAAPPQDGELVWITDDQKLYIGDGATLARDLVPVTGFNAEDAQDTIGAVFQSSTHNGISFLYNDAAGQINATVELDQLRQNVSMNGYDITGTGNISITGSVTADAIIGNFKGSIVADDSTIMVDAVDGKINLNGTINSDVIPDSNEAYDIGSAGARFKDLFLSGSTIHLGSALISQNSSGGVNLPAGSTIDGGPIGGAGAGQSLNVDIVGDDSTIIVNSSTNTLTGTFVGDITGSVFGDDSSLLVDGITGAIQNGVLRFADNVVSIIDPLFESLELQANSLMIQSDTDIGSAVYPTLRFEAHNGTYAAKTIMADGDIVGQISTRGWNGSDYADAGGLFFAINDASITPGDANLDTDVYLGSINNLDAVNGRYLQVKADGTTVAPVFQTGVYANDTARNTAIPTPAEGMIIFNQTGTKFQGWNGYSWVDLN